MTTTPYGTGGAGATNTKPKTTGPTNTNTNGVDTSFGCSFLGTCPAKAKIPLAAIIGGSVGAVIVVAFILFVGWRYRRRHYKPRPPAELSSQPAPDYDGKAELAGGSAYSAANILSKSQIPRKPTPGSGVSPVSPIDEKETALSPLAGRTEMDVPDSDQVPAGPTAHELHPEHARYEVQGQPHAPELVNAPRYEVQGSNPPPSANMNDGPFYELENSYRHHG